MPLPDSRSIFFSYFFLVFVNFLLSGGACRMWVTCIAQFRRWIPASLKRVAFPAKLIFVLIYARGTHALKIVLFWFDLFFVSFWLFSCERGAWSCLPFEFHRRQTLNDATKWISGGKSQYTAEIRSNRPMLLRQIDDRISRLAAA